MFEFGNPQYLNLLWSLPALAALATLAAARRRRQLRRMASDPVLATLAPRRSPGRAGAKFALLSLAVAAMALTAARPRYGIRTEETRRQGLELVVALDISNSMLAQDIKPSRLQAAKMAIAQLLSRLADDRVSLIVFAGDAFTQLPMTSDYGAARMFIDAVSPSLIANQGTDISTALTRSLGSFSASEARNKAIIVISDGEDHEQNAIELAKEAGERGIRIFTLGMGLPEGAPIPLEGRPNEYHRDRQGNTVITRLNEGMLQQLASAGGGTYIRANNSRVGLSELFDQLEKMEQGEVVGKVFAEYEEQFAFLAALALALLAAETLLAERASDFWRRHNPLRNIAPKP